MPEAAHIELAYPAAFAWAGASVLVLAAAAALFFRVRGVGTTFGALALRVVAVAAIALLISGVSLVRVESDAFEPHGVWRLVLDDADTSGAPAVDATFQQSPRAFVNRLRDAMAAGHPPTRAEVFGPRDVASRARDDVLALGVPCTAHWPDRDSRPAPRIASIDAPRALQPGEPARVRVTADTRDATLSLYIDGKPLESDRGEADLVLDQPGRHVLEAVLSDASGAELQRLGHVVRVSEKPRLLLLGLDDEQAQRASGLAPSWKTQTMARAAFSGQALADESQPVDVVLTTAEALFNLDGTQAHALSAWVARGGGLYVTGDGAKYVAPRNFVPEARRMLPVMLQQEGNPEERDPTLEEEIVRAEIAKVSVVFVLDRSGSMDAEVNRKPGLTRWRIAVKGVIDSLNFIYGDGGRESEAQNTRVGVLTFTLKPQWIDRPRNYDKFDIGYLNKRLSDLKTEHEYAELGYNTDIYAAVHEALNVVKQEQSAVKLIVILTDGADRPANARNGKLLRDLKDDAEREKISIYAVGIGDGFHGGGSEADAARRAIEQLAPQDAFRYIAADGPAAENAHAIFVQSVETAFQTYDKQKQEEEKQRKLREEEQKALEEQPPKVDVLPGDFALRMLPAGRQIFGDILPQPAPRAAWYARAIPRAEAAVALQLAADGDPPALAFQAWGQGRVAFWAIGGDPESLGEVAAWADYPALFASSLRWLRPREEPDVRLVGDATPEGVRLLDPLPGAAYHLKTESAEFPLELKDGLLKASEALPTGAAEIIESVDGLQRGIGDVYIATRPATSGVITGLDDNPRLETLSAKPPETRATRTPWWTAVLALSVLFLALMSFERLARRRA